MAFSCRQLAGDVVRRRLADRRDRPRYDIVGDLSGTLEAVLELPLQNISHGGALIHSHVPLLPNSTHRLTFDADGGVITADVRVRHVQPHVSVDGERTFLVGVEFLARHPVLTEQINRWLAAAGDGAGETAGL